MPGPAGAAGAETGRAFERGTSLVDVDGLASLEPWLGMGVGQGLPGARWWPTWSGLGLGSGLGSGPGQGARWRRTSSSQRPLPLELSEARSPPRRPGAARACARFVARFDHSSARFATLAARACARAASAHRSDSTWLGIAPTPPPPASSTPPPRPPPQRPVGSRWSDAAAPPPRRPPRMPPYMPPCMGDPPRRAPRRLSWGRASSSNAGARLARWVDRARRPVRGAPAPQHEPRGRPEHPAAAADRAPS
eukprot:scaffold75097_cov36-Phaeocystis_antarctica.AAC.1